MTPKHIQRWFEQVNYVGDDFTDYYVAAMRFFQCTPVERSNFKYIKSLLSDIDASETQVIYPNFTDQVFVCRYYVMVHKDFERGLRMADMLSERAKRKSLDPENESSIDAGIMSKKWLMMKNEARVLACLDAGVDHSLAQQHCLPDNDQLLRIISENT